MKVAPVMDAFARVDDVRQTLVHSGQHYDRNMSDVFFEHLGMKEPDLNLDVGSGSHAQQTAAIMSRFEPVVLERKPDLVLVYGDVNSTVAAALVCSKLGTRIGHVEAGLRSFDRTMPEEINRLVTDQLADVLFTPSPDGDANLLREGVAREKIYFVGNVMIDTLVRLLPTARSLLDGLAQRLKIPPKYGLVTLHRPANVDDRKILSLFLGALSDISAELPLVFPVHPRTLKELGPEAERLPKNIIVTEPLGYLDFLALQQRAAVIITDSGGIQEEATYLGVPCFTLRENTERPVTVTQGTNTLIGRDMKRLKSEVARALQGQGKKGSVPELWDGKASARIAAIVTAKPQRAAG